MSEPLFTVIFQPAGKRVLVKKGVTVFEAAEIAGVNIRNVCGGKGTCGKCKIIVQKGEVPSLSDSHKRLLSPEEISEGYRLACQTRILGDLEVSVPLESRIEGQQILTTATISKSEFNPTIRKILLGPELLSAEGDLALKDRLLREVQSMYSMQPTLDDSLLPKIDGIVDQRPEALTVTVCSCYRGDSLEIVDVEPGDTSKRNYGLAIDVGTTKIVTYLVDLNAGRIVDVGSDYNAQLIYGEDLLSRIDYAFREKHGLAKLQKAVVETINRVTKTLTSSNRIGTNEITDICIAGNTVMTYLLVGLDPSHLTESTVSVSRDPIELKAAKLGVEANPNARVYCLPSISRFVGGDAVADVLVSGLYDSPEISVLIDMGTNGEILLGSKGWLFSTSCAAGPAFEGWEIKFGMRSVEGAIEHVKIDPETLKASYTVIGGVKPRGICGSGLIDAIAEMYEAGILSSLGKIRKDVLFPSIRRGPEGFEYVLVPASETDIGKDIVVTQRDVDNLLDSKAAVCGAVAVLLKKVRVSIYDVQNLYLCGAFGIYMDPNSAVTIGIFPEFPNAKVVPLGNGSVAGAYLALLSRDKRRKADGTAEIATYYDLTTDPDFMEEYSAALFIPGNPGLFPTSSGRTSRKAG